MQSISVQSGTFLFTDLEGSTRTWEQNPRKMREFLQRHDEIARAAFETHRGVVVKSLGDGFLVAFDRVEDAVASVIQLQDELSGFREVQPPPQIRSAVHCGDAEFRDGDYFGVTLNRAARLLAIAHGGQCLLSSVARQELGSEAEAKYSLRELGYHRLRDIPDPEHVFQISAADKDRSFPPLRSDRAGRHNLPARFSTFVGRQFEWALVDTSAKRSRLITITGPGGTGKSRLAIEWAESQIDQYRDGVCLVCLDEIEDPAFVIPAIITALRITEIADQPAAEALCEWLATRELLLILDNCEHLSRECARVVATLLKGAPGCRVLTTSREALGVTGEALVAVHPLSVTLQCKGSPVQEEAAAVQLFCDRAAARVPSFELTDSNREIVTGLCRRLDGLPLALELAAAWIDVLDVSEIAERLQEMPPADPTAPGRQQSLTALIDWSYSRLTVGERLLFHKLAIFSGGWTLAAAEAVTKPLLPAGSSVIAGLSQLVRKSLVGVDTGAGGARRYSFLETIREFARAKLEEEGAFREAAERHLDWVRGYVDGAEREIQGANVIEWTQRLASEQANIRAALQRALDEGSSEAAVTIFVEMWRYWFRQGLLSEGHTWAGRCIPRLVENPVEAQARFHTGAGSIAWARGEYRDAAASFRRALALWREIGDEAREAGASNNLGMVIASEGAPAEACALFGEAAASYERLGESFHYGQAIANQGCAALEAGLHELARHSLRRGIEVFTAAGAETAKASVEHNLGLVYLELDDLAAASHLLTESCLTRLRLEDWNGLPHSLEALACLGIKLFRLDLAQQAAKAAEHYWRVTGSRPTSRELERRKLFLGPLTANSMDATLPEATPISVRRLVEEIQAVASGPVTSSPRAI